MQEIAQQIMGEAKSKKDYKCDTRKLQVVTRNGDGKAKPIVMFEIDGKRREYTPTPLCLGQIGDRVGIPRKYLERMQAEAPGLLASNVNHWFAANPEIRLLRTFDNGNRVARAFLSDRYRPLDNADLAEAVLPRLTNAGCKIESAELTDTRLYIQAVTPRLQAVIDRRGVGRQFEIDDIVQAGVVISNSELGCGSLRVEPMIYRLRCLNGLIVQEGLRRHHVRRGHGGEMEWDNVLEVFSDETREADDKAFWLKVRDVVNSALSEIKFQEGVRKLNAATRDEIDANPVDVVEVVVNRFGLSDNEGESVFKHLCKGGDLSRYGLLNAVTRTAEDVESYDRAVELERFGGQILELPGKEFLNN